MKATRKRIISSVLIFTMILSILPSFTVLAVDQQPEEDISAYVGVPALENVPFCVDEAVVSDAGHTVRLKYLEDSDNIAVFSNPDGTATKYIFSNPIKYIDDNGDYVDIDNTVETFGELTDDYKFRTKSAPATTYLPATIGMGEDVKVEHNGFSVQIIPMSDRFAAGTTVSSELKTGKDSAVLYSNVFGTGRSLKYTTLYNGVKEDIILNSYIANSNSFNFILKTNGLELAEINGGYYFVDEEDAVIYELSPIFVYDSAEVPNTTGGTYAIEEIKPNDIYALTLTVDESWLSGATYPVTIDPTITYDDSDGLEDAYSPSSGSELTGYNPELIIGDVGNTASYARTYIRFPNLVNTLNLDSDIIVSADLHLNVYSVLPGNNVISMHHITSSWVEYHWSASYPHDSYDNSTTYTEDYTIYGTGEKTFSITPFVENWVNNTFSDSSGLLIKFKNEASGKSIAFHSSEATNVANRPYLEVTYAALDNLIVSFKNAYSNMYMTVDKGWKYNNMNIYQAVLDNSSTSPQNSQKYRLRYDQTHDAYRIYPMCSMYGRGTVVDVLKISGSIQSGCNIDTWQPLEEYDNCQLFKVLSMPDGTYKLLLEHDENLVIAVNDNSTGSSSGTSSTSAGNIFLASISNSNDTKQRWNIIPKEEDMARDEHYSSLDITYPFAINSSTPYAISSCYGKRNVSSSNGNHWGLDIPAGEGTELKSMFAGKIVEIGYTSGRGHYIIVEATGANYTVYGKTTKLRYCYMHLKESPTTTTGLKEDDTVNAGQLVAKVGNTGTSSGAHLHISIITDGSSTTNLYTATTDPMAFFDDIEFTYSF